MYAALYGAPELVLMLVLVLAPKLATAVGRYGSAAVEYGCCPATEHAGYATVVGSGVYAAVVIGSGV